MSVRWRTNVADARNRWPICKSMSTEQTEAFLKLLEAYEGEGESDLSDQGRQIERVCEDLDDKTRKVLSELNGDLAHQIGRAHV